VRLQPALHSAVLAGSARLALFASQLGASRMVVTYEHADMATAWEDPDADDAPTGIVVIDAGPDVGWGGHPVRWHPMVMTSGLTTNVGGPAVVAHWGPPDRCPDGQLPAAVA